MKITLGDMLSVTGVITVLLALYWFDWRLTMLAWGLLLLVMGAVRVRREN